MSERALQRSAGLPVAAIYRETGFAWQTLRSLCGPTSVWNVLRSYGEEVPRARLLAGTGIRTFLGFRLGGLTLDQLATVVAARSRRRTTILRDLDLDELRRHLRRSNDPDRRYIANFHRGPIFGWGGGHHSPIGGYLEAADQALVLDTNRRVGPSLIGADRLYEAISTVDPSSGRSRGLLLVE
jgi:hypothetical protein